jgi:hypothetical protein
MPDTTEFRHNVRCLSCGHAWTIDYEATDAARSHAVLTAATCPVCGSGPATAVGPGRSERTTWAESPA